MWLVCLNYERPWIFKKIFILKSIKETYIGTKWNTLNSLRTSTCPNYPAKAKLNVQVYSESMCVCVFVCTRHLHVIIMWLLDYENNNAKELKLCKFYNVMLCAFKVHIMTLGFVCVYVSLCVYIYIIDYTRTPWIFYYYEIRCRPLRLLDFRFQMVSLLFILQHQFIIQLFTLQTSTFLFLQTSHWLRYHIFVLWKKIQQGILIEPSVGIWVQQWVGKLHLFLGLYFTIIWV